MKALHEMPYSFFPSKFDCYWFLMQVSMVKSSCKFALKELKHWMKPEKVRFIEKLSTECKLFNYESS